MEQLGTLLTDHGPIGVLAFSAIGVAVALWRRLTTVQDMFVAYVRESSEKAADRDRQYLDAMAAQRVTMDAALDALRRSSP